MPENIQNTSPKTIEECQKVAAIELGNTAVLPPVFSDEELAAAAMDYPLSFQYLSQLEEMTENRATFIISVAKFYGWNKDEGLRTVVQGWQPSFCPLQFFTVGGEGL
jgi:hypothetical protein